MKVSGQKIIKIVDYSSEWPQIYENEREFIGGILSGLDYRIEHIGSTSVEGLGAKPIIDILLGLEDFDRDSKKLVELMTGAGYNYVDSFEHIMPYRRYFNKKSDGVVTGYHVHSVQTGGWFWNRHIAFRNYLRENDDVRDEYYRVKKELSKKVWDDKNDYAWAKTDFIVPVQEKAMKIYFPDYEKG